MNEEIRTLKAEIEADLATIPNRCRTLAKTLYEGVAQDVSCATRIAAAFRNRIGEGMAFAYPKAWPSLSKIRQTPI